MAIRELPGPQQSQQYPPDDLLQREHEVRMEPQLRNFEFSDPLALEQYEGGSAMVEPIVRKYYSRK